MRAQEAFESKDPNVTTAYYDVLIRRGPIGQVAFGLFRAHKRSSKAKEYRRRHHRNNAYDAKGEALRYLNAALAAHGAFRWGWGRDGKMTFHDHVLYVETPHGQVSFHSASNYGGPAFDGQWDGQHQSKERILRFCDDVADLPQADRFEEWMLMPFGKLAGRLVVSLERETLEWFAGWSGLNSWPTFRTYVHQKVAEGVSGQIVQKVPEA